MIFSCLKNRRIAGKRDAQQTSRQTHIQLLVMMMKTPSNDLAQENKRMFFFSSFMLLADTMKSSASFHVCSRSSQSNCT